MPENGGIVKLLNGFFTTKVIFPDDTYDATALKRDFEPLPDLKTLQGTRNVKLVRELLRAWDPIAQKTVWEQETSSGVRGYDGGVLSTASNLVFQGRGSGELWVYAADTGNRIIAFKLGGGEVPKPPARSDEPFPKPPENTASAAEIEHGEIKFIEQCSRCHVFGPSVTPDLRKMPDEINAQFKNIVLKGAFAPFGMESFDDIL